MRATIHLRYMLRFFWHHPAFPLCLDLLHFANLACLVAWLSCRYCRNWCNFHHHHEPRPWHGRTAFSHTIINLSPSYRPLLHGSMAVSPLKPLQLCVDLLICQATSLYLPQFRCHPSKATMHLECICTRACSKAFQPLSEHCAGML
jgi:hypothetical protein